MRARAGVVTSTVLAMIVLLVGPAFATSNSMTVYRYGRLMANGAAVTLQVTVTCWPVTDEWGNTSDSVQTEVNLSQALRSGRITQASAEFTVTCNGEPQRTRVYLLPSTLAFHRGQAVAWGRSYDMGGGIPPFSLSPKVVFIR